MEHDQQTIASQMFLGSAPAATPRVTLTDEATMLQQAQRKRRVNRDRFRALATATTDVLWFTAADGSMEEDNSTWRAFTGQEVGDTCPPDRVPLAGVSDLKGWGWLECIHLDDREYFEQTWKKVIAKEQAYTGECRIRRYDGMYRTFLVRCVPVRDADGVIYEWMNFGTDITERKQAEEALRKSEELGHRTREALEGLLKMAEIFVTVPGRPGYADDGEHTVSISSAPGMSSEMTSMGQRLVELTRSILGCERVSITMVEPATNELRSVAVVGISPEQERLWRARSPGFYLSELLDDSPYDSLLLSNQVLMIDMTQPPFCDRPNAYGIHTMLLAPMSVNDQLVGYMSLDHGGIKHEYTEEEKALTGAIAKLVTLVIERERLLQERTQAQANELAMREATRRMDEFIGIVSHELRTPLAAIRASLQLVMRYLDSMKALQSIAESEVTSKIATIEEYLDRADRQVGVQNRLVSDLLDVSRIHANQLELHVKLCNLAAIVHETVEDQRHITATHTIHLHMETTDAYVLADAGRLGQVLNNYLSNALKYSEETSPVEVRLETEGGVVRVSVRDEGPGLTLSEQQRIWERFYRAEGIEVKSGSGVGLGLGLHICRTLIERMGGQAGVESAPGRGSTFWFTLPLADH